jgi:tetratricopeptide (TPR) repeat protein
MKKTSLLTLIALLFSLTAHAEAWRDLNSQVLQLYQRGDTRQALPVAQKALEKAKLEFGDDSAETALSLNNLALIQKSEGRLDEATRLYERSLDVAEKVAGPSDDDLLVPLNNLAMLYEQSGQKAKAEAIYQRVRSMGHAGTAESIKRRARQ